jgi:hypothetical protein
VSDTPIHDALAAKYEARRHITECQLRVADFAQSASRRGFDLAEEDLSQIPLILENAAGGVADQLLKFLEKSDEETLDVSRFSADYISGFLAALRVLTTLGPPREI